MRIRGGRRPHPPGVSLFLPGLFPWDLQLLFELPCAYREFELGAASSADGESIEMVLEADPVQLKEQSIAPGQRLRRERGRGFVGKSGFQELQGTPRLRVLAASLPCDKKSLSGKCVHRRTPFPIASGQHPPLGSRKKSRAAMLRVQGSGPTNCC